MLSGMTDTHLLQLMETYVETFSIYITTQSISFKIPGHLSLPIDLI